MIVPSESDEFDALKETANGAIPEVGVAVKLAVGDWLEVEGAVGTPPPLHPVKNIASIKIDSNKMFFLFIIILSPFNFIFSAPLFRGLKASIFLIISHGYDYCMATIIKKIEKNLIFFMFLI